VRVLAPPFADFFPLKFLSLQRPNDKPSVIAIFRISSLKDLLPGKSVSPEDIHRPEVSPRSSGVVFHFFPLQKLSARLLPTSFFSVVSSSYPNRNAPLTFHLFLMMTGPVFIISFLFSDAYQNE